MVLVAVEVQRQQGLEQLLFKLPRSWVFDPAPITQR
jgi:hypothetical protein